MNPSVSTEAITHQHKRTIMKPVKSKRSKLNLELHTAIGVGPVDESDLAAHSSPLTDADLSEVAAYGATRSCAGWGGIKKPGLPGLPGLPGTLPGGQ